MKLACLAVAAVISISVVPNGFAIQANLDAVEVCHRNALNSFRQLGKQSAAVLCNNARSNAPVECFRKALTDHRRLDEMLAVHLCKGATSLAPTHCYGEAERKTDLAKVPFFAALLCQGAESDAPVYCYQQLPENDLVFPKIVQCQVHR